jgi:beta-N-acetylhexosaminidase
MSQIYALITGLSGPVLTEWEKAFLKDSRPWGLILFQRNCETPAQVKRLVEEVRAIAGWTMPVLIDQEGGRVQRLKPPHWPAYPPGRIYGQIEAAQAGAGREAAHLGCQLMAHDLALLGIDVDCLPLLDLPVRGADDVIGDRALGEEPESVIALAKAQCTGLLSQGVLPVIKHIPGHGRALVDSHKALPRVSTSLDELNRTDFAPFRAMCDQPLAMTAHVIYDALDPDRPVTTSQNAIAFIRRDLNFRGALMSDDLSMEALSGSIKDRGEQALAAGCDLLLHCNGKKDEMQQVAEAALPLVELARLRCDKALSLRQEAWPGFDREAAEARFQELLALAGGQTQPSIA